MTSGGNNFNDFPEIVPTREITTKVEKTFLVFSSVAVQGPISQMDPTQCCSINSTRLNPLLSQTNPQDCSACLQDTTTV